MGLNPEKSVSKLKAGPMARSVATRILHPRHLTKAIRLQLGKKKPRRSNDDQQLATLSRMIPGGFLHYGYFDDPDRPPEEMSLAELGRAQHRYAELLLELAEDRDAPVLDVGCGMGGLSRMLVERGFSPVALTPDVNQASHLATALPDVPLIHCKFEDLPDPEQHAGRYGTIYTSESLQYLKLDRALPLMGRILKPGGRWIACDMFRTSPSHGKGGHNWHDFTARIAAAGWRIRIERDITANILPTLQFVEMLATRICLPLLEYGVRKFRSKQPGLHYVLEGVLAMVDAGIEQNLAIVQPANFLVNRRYMLLVMER